MGYTSKTQEQAEDTKMITGVNEHFAPNNITVTVAGVTLTAAQIVTKLQSRISAINAATTARAAALKASAAAEALLAETQPDITAARQIAVMMYSNQPEVLAVFGLAPKKTPAPLTLEEKAERAAKAKATRLARNTMGPKAKAKVKGTVPTAAPAATATPTLTPTQIVAATLPGGASATGRS